jgi:hypothetical protein
MTAPFTIALSIGRGIQSIRYGTDPHEYVHPSSTLPFLRAGVDGGAKQPVPLTKVSLSTTVAPNDTLTLTDALAAIAKVVIWVKPGVDALGLDFSMSNLTSRIFTSWDLLAWKHNFHSQPKDESGTLWTFEDHGFDCNWPLVLQCEDQSINPWQLWYSDKNLFGMHFATYGELKPTEWDVYLNGDTHQPGLYTAIPIAAGATLTFNLKAHYYPSKQTPEMVVPGAYSIQAARWPYAVRQDLYSPRLILGENFMAQSPGGGDPIFPENLNRWFNDPNLKIYDATTGKLCAAEGDYTGLTTLRDKIIGRIHWCVERVIKAGGQGCIHWDLYDAQRWAQPALSYKGNPVISPTECPELWYRDASWPVSIMEQVTHEWKSDGVNHYPNFLVGIALRAASWSNPPPNQSPYHSLETGVADLVAKIKFAYSAGARVFYIDSFGPGTLPTGGTTPPQAYAVELVRNTLAAWPDTLLIPEAYNRVDVYSGSYPWRDMFPSVKADPQAHLIWAKSAACVRWQNKGSIQMTPQGSTHNPNWKNTVDEFKLAYDQGDAIQANCFSFTTGTEETEVEQAACIYRGLKEGNLPP